MKNDMHDIIRDEPVAPIYGKPFERGAAPTYILGMKVSATSYEHAAGTIASWAEERLSKYVCVACVKSVMESYDSAEFREAINGADLVTPDGMPVVWGLRLLGRKSASRVYGPDLTPCLLAMAEEKGFAVGFYGGGSPEDLEKLLGWVRRRFPRLQVSYAWAPPFRALTPEEDRAVVEAVNGSGARILFVGLGTPKQDFWMAGHRPEIRAAMIGVGAAFDFLAGTKPQAPRWMMPLGLEWVFRLATEPRRLWKMYLKHNPRFVLLFALQVLRGSMVRGKTGNAPA